jgi:hypothetical protein
VHRITIAEFRDAQLGTFYTPQAKANAALFAAAPDLLAALDGLVNCPRHDKEDSLAYAQAMSALAKAKGEA